MVGKIFINYRRDDARDMAARIRDGLAKAFGDANVFMDVDNLMAGQRFDRELEKALAQTDVFVAVIGDRWMESLGKRQDGRERDYVREEIATALKRGVVAIPVLVERTLLPRPDALPEDIRDLVFHHKHGVSHEQFGRDIAGLVEAIRFARKRGDSGRLAAPITAGVSTWLAIGLLLLLALGIGVGILVYRGPAIDESEIARSVRIQREGTTRSEAPVPARSPSKPAVAVAPVQARCDGVEALVAGEKRCLKPRDTFRDCADCPEMVVVPAGEFTMGSPASEAERGNDEGPQREVTIAKPFAVGKFEVTFAEWDACVGTGGCKHRPYDHGWGRGKRPVIDVSWDDITKEFLPWLSRKTGRAYRLLTESEWEYAARAGTATPFSTGPTITTDQANFDGGSAQGQYRQRTIEVGSFAANAFGLHDVHGNVWEWVEDCYTDRYTGAPIDGSAVTSGDCKSRALRGGSWNYLPWVLRSAVRLSLMPDLRYYDLGFRLATTLGP